MTESDRIAKAGYAAWRSTSPHPLPEWEFLALPDRHRWRLGAEGRTAEEIRERCCIGLYIRPWLGAQLRYRLRWRAVADAMAEARLASEVA